MADLVAMPVVDLVYALMGLCWTRMIDFELVADWTLVPAMEMLLMADDLMIGMVLMIDDLMM